MSASLTTLNEHGAALYVHGIELELHLASYDGVHACCITYGFVTVQCHTWELVCQHSNLWNKITLHELSLLNNSIFMVLKWPWGEVSKLWQTQLLALASSLINSWGILKFSYASSMGNFCSGFKMHFLH